MNPTPTTPAKIANCSMTAFPADSKRATQRDFVEHRLDWSPVLALGLPAEWIGADLCITLDEVRRAVITIESSVMAGDYCRLAVRIVSKTHGPIDTKVFGFQEHLGCVDRADDRVGGQAPWPTNDSDLNRRNVNYHVLSRCGWDWYIAIPSTTLPLTEALAAYVRLFV